jgi:hypothetical protein
MSSGGIWEIPKVVFLVFSDYRTIERADIDHEYSSVQVVGTVKYNARKGTAAQELELNLLSRKFTHPTGPLPAMKTSVSIVILSF